jgi:regulator of protease activity HflC (stomatin/prohibitin superfamily)
LKKVLIALLGLTVIACQKVPAGHVGVKVYLLGGHKGVDHETLGPGRYFIGYNEELFLFPVFKQNHTWTKESTSESPGDESITMQTKEGLVMNADVGIMYSIKPENVAKVFQSYRRGIDEVTHVFLRNVVRDAFNATAAIMEAEAIYGYGKNKLLEEVEHRARQSVQSLGIDVEKIYLVGNLRLPPAVTNAIDAKLQAMQLATQRENELRQAEAEAKKVMAAATGEANSNLLRARAEAEGNLARARAEAEANLTVAKSLTKELVEYERVKRWDGALPKYAAGGTALFNFKE